MADKRRSRWPQSTIHTLFFVVGCNIGWLEAFTTEAGDERLSARVQDLRHRMEQASMWPQRQAVEALWPLSFEMGRLYQELHGGHEVEIPESYRQLEDDLRRILPPDVQF